MTPGRVRSSARSLVGLVLPLVVTACGSVGSADAARADVAADTASAPPDTRASLSDVPPVDATLDAAPDAPTAMPDIVAPADGRPVDPGCVPDPAIRMGFPNNCSTGVPFGTSLVVVDHAHPMPTGLPADNQGWQFDTTIDRVIFTANGAVMDGVDLETGSRTYGDQPSNVTIRNSRIRCQGVGAFCLALADGGAVIDSDIGGGDTGTQFQGATMLYASGSAAAPVRVLRAALHSGPQNLKSDGYVTVTDSYLYGSPGFTDVWVDPSTGTSNTNTHSDQVFVNTAIDVVLVHDTLRGGDNSTIDFTGTGGVTAGSVVRDSLFMPDLVGGSHFGIGGGGTSAGLTLMGNTFMVGYTNDAWQHGFSPAPTASGDVWSDGTSAD